MLQRHMPHGYKIEDGKVIFDDERAAVIKKIFEEYHKGSSLHAIAKELTNAGFLNANNKSNWNHGSVGKILQNIKYLGDDFYPRMIDKEIFESVQKRRKKKEQELGRTLQPNSMKNQSIFSSKLKCGECGDIYRKYIEHAGRPSEKSNWKCKRYIYQNRVHCRNLFLTEKDIETIFISATNKIISRMWMLDKEKKKEPPRMTLEIRKLEERIKELEEEEHFSSKELSELIFKRAKAYYSITKIDDYDYNTEKIKQSLAEKEQLTEFDEDIFIAIIKQIVIYKDGRILVEFINGITMEEYHEKIREDE
ncbi:MULTISPECIES: recombinase family protein [Bacillota]|uniref:Recombinase n=1 Tax=Anaerotignum neopropionicum TaxID=36847 RepID=A0A136WGH9_9FIRM|nr:MULTISPECIES: recombinase family protein [Bacillota]KXL53622.1 recombinase [Anaerotignum neopropionicum]WSI03073.1 recombinase family protein [Sedimentibacter sp. MB36-C1]